MAISSQDADKFRLKHAEELLALFEGARGRPAPLTRPNQSVISPRQDHSCSFDHLVSGYLQRQRHIEVERFGSLEIDD
jgi:hypothetical protein